MKMMLLIAGVLSSGIAMGCSLSSGNREAGRSGQSHITQEKSVDGLSDSQCLLLASQEAAQNPQNYVKATLSNGSAVILMSARE